MSTQLFGEVCIPFVMVYYLSSSMLTQSVVVLLVERAGSKEARGLSLPGLLKDVFTKPPILGLLVGILCLALDVRPPELVMQFAGYMSATVIPLALMYCGFILYEVGLKNLRFLPGIPTMLIIRLVVSPLICTGMCALTGITGLARSVFIVEAALPVVTQITVMAGAYGADEEYAAVGSSLSMLGSFFTIPILMLILG
jgi:predicted permease